MMSGVEWSNFEIGNSQKIHFKVKKIKLNGGRI